MNEIVMGNYQFQILQYQHDIMTGEFVNIGVVLYGISDNELKIKVLDNYRRVSNFFGCINERLLKERVSRIETAFLSLPLPALQNTSLEDITLQVLNNDDGAFKFSLVKNGVDVSLETALEDIFARFVGKYCYKPKKTFELDRLITQIV